MSEHSEGRRLLTHAVAEAELIGGMSGIEWDDEGGLVTVVGEYKEIPFEFSAEVVDEEAASIHAYSVVALALHRHPLNVLARECENAIEFRHGATAFELVRGELDYLVEVFEPMWAERAAAKLSSVPG